MCENRPVEQPEWQRILPHRPPFLFVDRVISLDPGISIRAEWTPAPDAPFFSGHFPGRPLVPGVLITEALAQTSGLLLGLSQQAGAEIPPTGGEIRYLLTEARMKYLRATGPAQVLELTAEAGRQLGELFHFNVSARTGQELVATGSLILASQTRG